MKSLLPLLLISLIFVQCTKEQEIFLAETWHGTYEIEINNRSTNLSPLVIDRAGNLSIDGTKVPYLYDIFTYTVTISDAHVNRTLIHYASFSFKQEGVLKTFNGEISTKYRSTTGKFTGTTRR